MTIFIGADHRGFELKEKVLEFLAEKGIPFEDFGAFELDPDDGYNEYGNQVAEAVLSKSNPNSKGLLICGSANGIAIQANRHKGVRAIIALNPEMARMGRQHLDANILCLSADFAADQFADIIDAFLTTDFLEQEEYLQRIEKMDKIGA